jgi:hypothetical protein
MKQLTAILMMCAFTAAPIFAGEIREFDVKTLERLGNELTRVSRQPDRGAIDAVRKRAKQTAIAALHGRLFKLHYDYVVLDDPDGAGFLVYALGAPPRSDETVLGGHSRVTVSPDGARPERVDALSQTMMVDDPRNSGMPARYKLVALYFNQIISNRPVETLIYASNLAKKNIYVGTPDGKMWVISKGRMKIDTSKPSNKTEAGAARKAFNR